jgi:hypothetical protein
MFKRVGIPRLPTRTSRDDSTPFQNATPPMSEFIRASTLKIHPSSRPRSHRLRCSLFVRFVRDCSMPNPAEKKVPVWIHPKTAFQRAGPDRKPPDTHHRTPEGGSALPWLARTADGDCTCAHSGFREDACIPPVLICRPTGEHPVHFGNRRGNLGRGVARARTPAGLEASNEWHEIFGASFRGKFPAPISRPNFNESSFPCPRFRYAVCLG